MGITRLHRGITIIHDGAARRRIVDPIHAALEKGLGDNSGSDCGMDSRCDECMSWSSEEMESYVKWRKSLASKGRGRKSGSKTPSSPGRGAPVVNVDVHDKIASHIASLSKNVVKKMSAMSEGLMAKVSELLR